ncbi:putative rhamnosyl transferase, partial [Parabacteroides distasonis]|nr:putative rhamnosyl transferase [Parabacteroides distasonis]
MRKDSVDFLFSDSYLNERYSIFENTCFSSMCNQKNKDFIWLVFFDKRTPKSFVHRNEQLQKLCKNFKPIYVDM